MRILITGIEGFVAPILAEKVKLGNEIFGTYFLEPIRKKGHNYMLMDVLDKNNVSEVINAVKPDVIYHLAGFSSVAESWKNPELAMKINAGGTRNLLDAVVEAQLNPKILVVSSSEIYGGVSKFPLKEGHLLKPQSPYAQSRLKQEEIISEFPDVYIIIARSFNHTGPGQPPKFVCPSFAHQVAMIEKGLANPIIYHGVLDIRRDFSDVRDVVAAYELLIEKGKSHEAYNVCSGKLFSLGQILDKLISFSSKKIEKRLDLERVRKIDLPILLGDNSKIRAHTGWEPKIDFYHTLRDMFDYFMLQD